MEDEGVARGVDIKRADAISLSSFRRAEAAYKPGAGIVLPAES